MSQRNNTIRHLLPVFFWTSDGGDTCLTVLLEVFMSFSTLCLLLSILAFRRIR
eukprot:JP443380.1.p2 GENE.JP443380.1~~JP443380.1.p2  ORF type:complete len:53 (-),score=2.87 JP443380.1:50-208(-)